MTADTPMVKGARALREEGFLLDYTIEVEDEEFKVHKVVMASVSDYFKAMLTGGMKESQEDKVRLEGQSAAAVSDIIDFMYSNEFGEKSVASLKEILDCAWYLQVPSAIEKCTVALCHKVEAKNCFDMLFLFKDYTLSYGIEYTTEYIKSNIKSVVQSFKEDGMSHDSLMYLIDRWEWSEHLLFDAIRYWIFADYANRREYVNDLMPHVRFCLIGLSELEAMRETEIFRDLDGTWCDLIEQALRYHRLPIHQKVLDDSIQTQFRDEPSIVSILEEDNPDLPMYALDKENSWHGYDVPETPIFNGWTIYTVTANNFLVLCDEDWHWTIFDPRTLTWTPIAVLEPQKDMFALVHHDKQLFVLGGSEIYVDDEPVDRIDTYSFHTNMWETLSSKLPIPLVNAIAFSIADSIYVIGGRDSQSADNRLKRLDCFHPASDTWEVKAPMLLETNFACEIQVMELFGEKIIIILDKDFSLQFYRPSTNQWSVWKHLGLGRTKLVWDDRQEDANKMLVKGNCIYMVNFRKINAAGECEKWTFSEKGVEKIESIDSSPFRKYDGNNGEPVNNLSVLLSMAQYKSKNAA